MSVRALFTNEDYYFGKLMYLMFFPSQMLQDWWYHPHSSSTTPQRTHRAGGPGGFGEKRCGTQPTLSCGNHCEAGFGLELGHRPSVQSEVCEAAQQAVHPHPPHGGPRSNCQDALSRCLPLPGAACFWWSLTSGCGQRGGRLSASGSLSG